MQQSLRFHAWMSIASMVAVAAFIFIGVVESAAMELRYGTDQCFARTYNKAHLSKNPGQQVTQIRFVHRPSAYDPQERLVSQGLEGRLMEQIAYMDVRFRDSRQLKQVVICTARGGKQVCGVECDGGRFAYRFKTDGAMLIDLRSGGGMMLGAGCGEGDAGQTFWLGDNKDDQLFRLDPADMSICSDLR